MLGSTLGLKLGFRFSASASKLLGLRYIYGYGWACSSTLTTH